jgi:SAM-dependent methyltransferase
VILDYGTGSGEIVEEGRRTGLEVYGCEVFYEGGSTRKEIEKKGWLGTIVREIDNGVIPFGDGFFDVVTSNQVIEHVENLDAVLGEVHRVLKPGGCFLSIFPTKERIGEGHCGIPLIHWFSRNSPFRFYYALAMRLMGFGYFKGSKSASQWVNDFLQWIDSFTYYRSADMIFTAFGRYFEVTSRESDYISFRLNHHEWRHLPRLLEFPLIEPLGCQLLRRFACMVVLARKPVLMNSDLGSPFMNVPIRSHQGSLAHH